MKQVLDFDIATESGKLKDVITILADELGGITSSRVHDLLNDYGYDLCELGILCDKPEEHTFDNGGFGSDAIIADYDSEEVAPLKAKGGKIVVDNSEFVDPTELRRALTAALSGKELTSKDKILLTKSGIVPPNTPITKDGKLRHGLMYTGEK